MYKPEDNIYNAHSRRCCRFTKWREGGGGGEVIQPILNNRKKKLSGNKHFFLIGR